MMKLFTVELLLMFMKLVTATINQQRSIQGGLNLGTEFHCSTSNLDEWTFTDQSGSHKINDVSNVNLNEDTLRISNIVSYHEGVYRCFYGNSVDIFNMTVLAVPQFSGCSPVSNCSLNEKINVTEGQSIPVTMSLQFVNGGARGLNQSIQYLRFKTSTLPFVISCFNSGSCSTTGSRVSYYRSTNDPWNISFIISNATLQDTDTYYVEAGVINPSITNEIQTITSTVSINIISKTVPHVSSTSIEVSSTSLYYTSSTSYSISSIETSTQTSSTASVTTSPPTTDKITSTTTTTSTTNDMSSINFEVSTSLISLSSKSTSSYSISSTNVTPTSEPVQVVSNLSLPLAITMPIIIVILIILLVLIFVSIYMCHFFWKTKTCTSQIQSVHMAEVVKNQVDCSTIASIDTAQTSIYISINDLNDLQLADQYMSTIHRI